MPAGTDPAATAWYFLSVGQGFNLNHWVSFQRDDATLKTLIVNLFRGMGAHGAE